ncbi:MAG: hypothetical protein MRY83_22465, partial [Flavobacteriales bacterium]|nr:hypothetical protein [Flavobacteriales bacterium]
YQIKPTYVGKSDKRGMFEIPYLREGNYKIVALEDKNGNYLFDPVEQIGFLDSLVSPQDSLSFSLRLFQEDLEEQFLSSFKFTQPGKLLVKTNKPYENINIDPINYSFKKQWFVSDIYKKTDSAVFWFTDFPTIDTLELIVSIDDQIDTVAVNLVTQDSLNASVTCAIDKSTLNPYELLSFKSNVPMKEILSDSILIVRDTIVINAIFGIREGRFREVFLSDSLFESTRYKITFLPGALKSIFDTQNPDSITFEYTIPKKSDFPELTVSLDVDYKGATVLELFSNTDKELKKPLKTVRYSNVEDKMGFGFQKTGKYKLKLILDGDNDGQWSTGNYLEHVQPERVYLYDGVFELKPGFDLDIDWKIKP